MGIILGLLFKNEMIIASGFCGGEKGESSRDYVTNTLVYNFGPELFQVSLTGKYDDIQQFNLKLTTNKFVGSSISTDLFVTTCYKIIKQQYLDDLTLVIANFDGEPYLHLISERGIEVPVKGHDYWIVLPRSFSKADHDMIDHLFATVKDLLSREEASIFLKNVARRISELHGGPGKCNFQFMSFSALISEG